MSFTTFPIPSAELSTVAADARTALGLGTAATEDVSTNGGANNVPQFNANGDIVTGVAANDNVIMNPGGNVWLPDKRGLTWLKQDGTPSGARVYLWGDHDAGGHEVLVESQNKIAFVPGANSGIQIGLVRSTNSKQHVYLQDRYTPTSGVPLGSSLPLYFSTSYWNGSSGAISLGHVGIHGRGRADGQAELVLFAGSTWPTLSTDGTMPEVVAVTPEGLRDPLGNNPAFVPLTDETTINLTCSSKKARQQHSVTLGGSRTLAMSGIETGMVGTIIVAQDATGSRLLTLPEGSSTQTGFALSTAPFAVDILSWTYAAGTYYWTIEKTFNVPFDSNASAFLAAAGIAENTTEGNAINTLVKQLKSFNLWNELIAAYPVVGGNSTAHSKDLKGTYNSTFGAGVTHGSNGITGNASTTGWMDSGISISALGIQNSVGLYVYNKTELPTDGGAFCGSYHATGRAIIRRTTTTLWLDGPSSGLNTRSRTAGTDFRGHILGYRSNSTTVRLRFNALDSGDGTSNSVAAATNTIRFLASEDDGDVNYLPSNCNLAFCAVTTGNWDDTKWANFKTCIDTFQTAVNRINV